VVGIASCVRPFAEGGLNEPLGLAVGLGAIGAGPGVTNAQALTRAAECFRAIGCPIVGKYAGDLDAQAAVIADQAGEETQRTKGSLIAEELAVGYPGVIDDGYVEELPARSRRLLLAISMDSMPWAPETGQALRVQVNQLAWPVVLVALHRRL